MTVDSGQGGANEDLEGLAKRGLSGKVLREPQKHPTRKGKPSTIQLLKSEHIMNKHLNLSLRNRALREKKDRIFQTVKRVEI